MKASFCFVLFILLCAPAARAQYVAIPDANFRAWLQTNYTACMGTGPNAGMLDTTCAEVVSEIYVNLNSQIISNLEGIQYFDNLEILDCPNNILAYVPSFPNSLLSLYCDFNQLTSLPELPASLQTLSCVANDLTSLPELPNSLKNLWCPNNQLTYLPALPDSLESLICSYNLLTSLPALPNSLIELTSGTNQLTSLPALPNTLQLLTCHWNNLTNLPALPSSLEYLDCGGNNNLYCLPTLPGGLQDLNCENTGIACLPNDTSSLATEPPGLLLCGPGNNPNGCNIFQHVEGTAFYDLDGNDTLGVGEPPFIGLIVLAQPGGYTASTNASGSYQVAVDSVTPYTVMIPFPPPYRTVIPASHTGSLPGSNTVSTGNDFAIQHIPNVNDLRITLAAATPPNIGFNQHFVLTYHNIGTTALPSSVQLVYSDTLFFTSATPAPTTQAGNTLTWNVGTLAPWQSGNIHAYFTVPANVNLLGDTLYSTATITPVAGDTVPADNTSHLAQEVVGSYDPNDKQVLPSGDISTNEWLTYTVRFQNTGTAAAQTVVIRDTLDNDLNIPTITTTSASHNYVFELNGLNAAWYFNNIQLPDSNTNEPGSHGFVQYRVKARHNLAVGTEVSNTASIYFDFNPPIVTNTVVNTVTQLSGFAEAGVRGTLRLFPNPSTGLVTVELPSWQGQGVGQLLSWEGQGVGSTRIDVLDITERVVYTATPLLGGAEGGSTTLDLQHLPAGLYTVRAATATGVLTAKVVRN